MHIQDLTDSGFGTVITDVDLAELRDEEWEQIYRLWNERALLIFPAVFLDKDVQDAFARRFGNLEFPRTAISNIGKNGEIHQEPEDDVVKVIRGNEGWHHDSTYMPVQALGAVLVLRLFQMKADLLVGPICEPPLNHWIKRHRTKSVHCQPIIPIITVRGETVTYLLNRMLTEPIMRTGSTMAKRAFVPL